MCASTAWSLDTAAAYRNEQEVGRAIATSGVARDELFVTTKLWIQDAGEESAEHAFDLSLERLGLDYLDLYLIHQPFGDYYGAWRAMQQLHRDGRARAIGVANFYPDRLVDLIDHNEVKPAVNQIECHPFFQRTTEQELMHERGVQIESWGPFAEGRNSLFTDPTLAKIAADHGKSVAQVVLRWLTQRNVVVIPKSVRRNACARTSTSSTSISPMTRWHASPPSTPARRCSSTTTTPHRSAAREPRASTESRRRHPGTRPAPDQRLRAQARLPDG